MDVLNNMAYEIVYTSFVLFVNSALYTFTTTFAVVIVIYINRFLEPFLSSYTCMFIAFTFSGISWGSGRGT